LGTPPNKFYGKNVIKLLAQIGKHAVKKEQEAKFEESEAQGVYDEKMERINADVSKRQSQYDQLSVTSGQLDQQIQELNADLENTVTLIEDL